MSKLIGSLDYQYKNIHSQFVIWQLFTKKQAAINTTLVTSELHKWSSTKCPPIPQLERGRGEEANINNVYNIHYMHKKELQNWTLVYAWQLQAMWPAAVC